jgi:hypothetical protein
MSKKITKLFGVALLGLALTGCGGPKLDGKDQAAFSASVATITVGMEQQEKMKFQNDVATISSVAIKAIRPGDDVEQVKRDLLDKFDGMSVSDVAEEAEAIRKKQG